MLLLTVLLAGCRPTQSFSGGYTAADIAGVWVDEGGATFQIELQGREAVVTSIVDYDSEVFIVQEFGPDNGIFRWEYYVPSSNTTVQMWIDSVYGDTAQSHWANSEGSSGAEELKRTRSF